MSEGEELLSREEVLAGLPARRARALLFAIEQHSARQAADREIGPMSLLGERAAEDRELAWIETFALGREPPRQPTIREIERAAEHWAPLVPQAPSIRAATANLLAERHQLERRRLPGVRAALGLDDDRVAAAYQRQTGQPIGELWTGLGPLERVKWAATAPARWLETTSPFRAAAALTFLLSMGQTVVIVPIAVATVGPVAALASIVVIGILAVAATAAIAETATRSAEVRFRGGFFGRLVVGALGPRAGAVPAALGIAGVVLPTLSALVGLGLLLAIALPLPATLWAVAAGAVAVFFPLASRPTASFGGLMALGMVSIALLALLCVVALVQAAAQGSLGLPAAGPPAGVGLEVALGVIIGVLLGSYADPVYTVQIGRLVLPRDPDGEGFVRGSMAGMAAFVLLTAVFSAVLIVSVPIDRLAAQPGSALDTVSAEFGAAATLLGLVIGICLFGIRLYGNAIALFAFVAERLPGRAPARVVLATGRGRVLLSHRDGDPSPAVILSYRGMRGERPVLAVSRPAPGGEPSAEEHPLLAGARSELADTEVAIRVLDADERRLHLELETALTVSYEDEEGLIGRGVAETLLAEDGSGALAAWLLRTGSATAQDAAEQFGIPRARARRELRDLVAAGSAREPETDRFEPLLAARRRRGAGLGADVWGRLGVGDPSEGEGPSGEASSRTRRRSLAEGAGRTVVCSLPMVGLTVLSAALLAAGTASVAGPIRIVGVIAFATISGVLPPMLLLAARRRSDLAGVSHGGRLVSTPVMAAMLGAALAALVLHATTLWTAPGERLLAALAAATAIAAIVFAARQGSFRPATLLDIRPGRSEGSLRVLAEEAGRAHEPQLTIAGAEVPAEGDALLAGGATLGIEGEATGPELRISAQRLDPSGSATALPLEVELRGGQGTEVRRLDEVGGSTTFDLDQPSWRLLVRLADQPDEVAGGDSGPEGEQEEPAAPGRRRRGGEGSPLDKL